MFDIETMPCLNVIMKVSLNILLENFRHYRLESRIDESREIAFRQARLLPANTKDLDPDFLYIGLLSDILALTKIKQDAILNTQISIGAAGDKPAAPIFWNIVDCERDTRQEDR